MNQSGMDEGEIDDPPRDAFRRSSADDVESAELPLAAGNAAGVSAVGGYLKCV